MKRELENSELPSSKRKAASNAVSVATKEQNSEDVNAIEYLDILLKLKGRLEGILRTNEMTNVPIEDNQAATNLDEEFEESHQMVAEEISAEATHYSEVLPTPAQPRKTVFKWLQNVSERMTYGSGTAQGDEWSEEEDKEKESEDDDEDDKSDSDES